MRDRPSRLRRHGDLAIGIVLGIVVGLALIALFVFVFSEQTVDSASIDNGATTSTPATTTTPAP